MGMSMIVTSKYRLCHFMTFELDYHSIPSVTTG